MWVNWAPVMTVLAALLDCGFCARTPMQWLTEPNAGFTKSDQPVLPVIREGLYSFQHVNLADQRWDANSLPNGMERIIRKRKEVPEIGWGIFLSFLQERQKYWRSGTTAQQLKLLKSFCKRFTLPRLSP
jgi:glycosidase